MFSLLTETGVPCTEGVFFPHVRSVFLFVYIFSYYELETENLRSGLTQVDFHFQYTGLCSKMFAESEAK